jgi:hypothetical protein
LGLKFYALPDFPPKGSSELRYRNRLYGSSNMYSGCPQAQMQNCHLCARDGCGESGQVHQYSFFKQGPAVGDHSQTVLLKSHEHPLTRECATSINREACCYDTNHARPMGKRAFGPLVASSDATSQSPWLSKTSELEMCKLLAVCM